MKKASQAIQALRQDMDGQGLAGFLVPRTDIYLGEYVAAEAERLRWLTGFTGSAGLGVILKDRAALMTDGRYTLQTRQEMDPDLFEVVDSQKVKLQDWLAECGYPEADPRPIGYDPALHSAASIEEWETAGLPLSPVSNLVDRLWRDRPAPPISPIFLFDHRVAGQTAEEKIHAIQCQLKAGALDGVLITKSDSIAWLLNVRGNDIPHNPVVLSFLFVPSEGRAQWFVDRRKVTEEVLFALSPLVMFEEEVACLEVLKDQFGKKILFDPKRSAMIFRLALEQGGAVIVEGGDPCILPRASKTKAEQESIRRVHVADGIAMVKFLCWLDGQKSNGAPLDECAIAAQLLECRAAHPAFREPSFDTIAGFNAHGAIIHYHATPQSNQAITGDGLLLVDSGGQYYTKSHREDFFAGTTDITRTVSIGNPDDDMRQHYTIVLKGHVALSRAVFAPGDTGKMLDGLARAPLQAAGLDYAHGTGHGVGCYLSVHEEAATGISPRATEPLATGMVLSNEPGYYKEGAYGIRIENLLLVTAREDGFYGFETLTLCPYARDLILADRLSQEEKDWINDYHARVYSVLSPYLNPAEKDWLSDQTKGID